VRRDVRVSPTATPRTPNAYEAPQALRSQDARKQ
jgi:hypothetical protein